MVQEEYLLFIIQMKSEKKALQTAEYTDCQEILVEEYNDGYEFNMMTWVMDGKVNVISIADREKTGNGRGNASAQHTKCLSIPFPGGGRKKCHRYSAELYPLYRTDGRCIIHAVFSGNLAGAFRYVRLQDVSLDMNMS